MSRPKHGEARVIPTCHPERLHQARLMCKSCYLKDYRTRRRAVDPLFEKYMGWEKHLRTKYGISPDQFFKMLEEQGGHCALCSMKPDEKYNAFCVDHDHTTGKIRGVLCKFCNSKLGWYENRKPLIQEYVK